MKWETGDIIGMLIGAGGLTFVGAIIGNAMGWLRFGKKDKAEVGKLESETDINKATIAEKRILGEIKISDAALQWTANLASRLEQANAMIDRKTEENERLHSIISVMKKDFEREVQKLKDSFNARIKELEREFDKSRQDLLKEREENREEIRRLKEQIDGARL